MSSSDQPEAGRIFTCGLPPRRGGAPGRVPSADRSTSAGGGGGAGGDEPWSYGAAGAEMSPSATGPAPTVTIPGLLTADLPTTDEHQAGAQTPMPMTTPTDRTGGAAVGAPRQAASNDDAADGPFFQSARKPARRPNLSRDAGRTRTVTHYATSCNATQRQPASVATPVPCSEDPLAGPRSPRGSVQHAAADAQSLNSRPP